MIGYPRQDTQRLGILSPQWSVGAAKSQSTLGSLTQRHVPSLRVLCFAAHRKRWQPMVDMDGTLGIWDGGKILVNISAKSYLRSPNQRRRSSSQTQPTILRFWLGLCSTSIQALPFPLRGTIMVVITFGSMGIPVGIHKWRWVLIRPGSRKTNEVISATLSLHPDGVKIEDLSRF